MLIVFFPEGFLVGGEESFFLAAGAAGAACKQSDGKSERFMMRCDVM
jgi:hypothetical protein